MHTFPWSFCSAPPRLGQDIDSALDPELKLFQFLMDGADGCSGAPIFTETRQVMGLWISQVGDFKLGVLVHSICEWLRRTFNFQEVSSLCNVALIPLPFVRCIFFPANSELLGVYSFYVRTRLVVIIQGHFVFCVQF
jgi:hypothetical protein